jgi:hypothetical protein
LGLHRHGSLGRSRQSGQAPSPTSHLFRPDVSLTATRRRLCLPCVSSEWKSDDCGSATSEGISRHRAGHSPTGRHGNVVVELAGLSGPSGVIADAAGPQVGRGARHLARPMTCPPLVFQPPVASVVLCATPFTYSIIRPVTASQTSEIRPLPESGGIVRGGTDRAGPVVGGGAQERPAVVGGDRS